MADRGHRGHKYVGEKKGVVLHLKNGKTLFGPSVGKLNYFSGFRRPFDSSNSALATIATGKIPSVSPVDINTFHTSRGHAHEKSLRFTASQLGGVLEGSLRECEGCSVAKCLGKPIGRTTSTRVDDVLLNLGSVVHSRNVTWARLPPSVPVSVEKVRSVSVSRQRGKLDPSRHGEVEVDEDVDREKSSESTGVRPRVTARLVAPTSASIPCGRAAPAGGRGTAAATSMRGATMREIPGKPVHSSAGIPGGFAMPTPLVTSAGVCASGGTASPGPSVESSPSVFEEDEADDSPSSKLGGRAAHELRWLGETPVVRQGRTRGE